MKLKKHIKFLADYIPRIFTCLVLQFTMVSLFSDSGVFIFNQNHIIKIFIFVAALGVITAIKVNLEKKKSMLKLSFLQRRLVFAPFYFIAVIIFTYDFFWRYGFGLSRELGTGVFIISSLTFVISFFIITSVSIKRFNKTKREYSEIIEAYKKRLG